MILDIGLPLALAFIMFSLGLSEFAVPSAVYGICMFIVSIPALLVLRRVFAAGG